MAGVGYIGMICHLSEGIYTICYVSDSARLMGPVDLAIRTEFCR
jgi:hypothetical protein